MVNNKKKYSLETLDTLECIDVDCNYIYTDIEKYLYSSSDDRVLTSNVEDIEGGDNFADYCKEFFEMLEEEEYWDD